MADSDDRVSDPLLREDFRGFVFMLAFTSAALAVLFAMVGYRGGLGGSASLGLFSVLSLQSVAALLMWWRLRGVGSCDQRGR